MFKNRTLSSLMAWPTVFFLSGFTWMLLPANCTHGMNWMDATHSPDRYALMFFVATILLMRPIVGWRDAESSVILIPQCNTNAWYDAISAYTVLGLLVPVWTWYAGWVSWWIPTAGLVLMMVWQISSRYVGHILDKWLRTQTDSKKHSMGSPEMLDRIGYTAYTYRNR